MVMAYIALGSNLGDRQAWLEHGFAGLAALPRTSLIERSPIVETEPVGPAGQGPYLNAAASLSTELEPFGLLEGLLDIERQAGRIRAEGVHWGPRTLDLDILLYGHTILVEPGLTIPHPMMHERSFVLLPLASIAAEVTHPALGRTIEQLLAEVVGLSEKDLPPD